MIINKRTLQKIMPMVIIHAFLASGLVYSGELNEGLTSQMNESGKLRVPMANSSDKKENFTKRFFGPTNTHPILSKVSDNLGGADNGGGVLAYLKRNKTDGRYLLTANITAKDLGYTSSFRNARGINKLPESLEEIQDVNIKFLNKPIFLVSMTHSGSAGAVRLGFLDSGRPVAVKTYYPMDTAKQINEAMMRDFKGAMIADQLGIGPAVYGKYMDKEGKINIVTDVVPGDFPEVMGESITTETIEELLEIKRRLADIGKVLAGDFQFFITPEGHIQCIDQASLLYVDPVDPEGDSTFIDAMVTLLNYARPPVRTATLSEMREKQSELYGFLKESIGRVRLIERGVYEQLRHSIEQLETEAKSRFSTNIPRVPAKRTRTGHAVTFIDLLRANFTGPVNLIDVGSGDKARFCFRVDEFLKQRGINARVHGVSPVIGEQAMAEGVQKGVILNKMRLEGLTGVVSEKQKYRVIVLSAPDFQLEDIDKFFWALDYLLTDDGVIIIRPDAYGDGMGGLAQTMLRMHIAGFARGEWQVRDDVTLNMQGLRDETPIDYSGTLIIKRVGGELKIPAGLLGIMLSPTQAETRRHL